MFSGKTEELIRRLNRARIAKLKVETFKPSIDIRYSDEDVVSHNESSLHSIVVESASQILFYSNDVDVIGIDEAQFLTMNLSMCVRRLQTRALELLSPDLTWIIPVSLSGLCPLSWLWQKM